MAFTYSKTGNRFEVIGPAPSVEEFLQGAWIRNEYDLEVNLVDPAVSAELDSILVRVRGTGFSSFAYASGVYAGVGSELWLVI